MTTALPSSPRPSLPLTAVRDFIQSREHDGLLLQLLRAQFDPIPAKAMMHHRLPMNSWRHDQIDGAQFHTDLTEAIEAGATAKSAPQHLRPALAILRRFGFESRSGKRVDGILMESPTLGLRGKADLIGRIHGLPALVEIKTVHEIPADYALLEHSIQAAMLFALAWGRPPRPMQDRVAILYVTSTHPHRAFLREVQLPRRFFHVGSQIAAHLLGKN